VLDRNKQYICSESSWIFNSKDITDEVPMYGPNNRLVILSLRIWIKMVVITEADKQIVGHPNPDYTYGITNTVRYKGFDLNVWFRAEWVAQYSLNLADHYT
jgi:hypothetical protein